MASSSLWPPDKNWVSGDYGDAWEGWRHGSPQSSDGPSCDLRRGDLFSSREGRACSDHVRLQEATLQEHLVIVQSLEDGCEDSLGDGLADFDAVVAVHQDFRLDDRDDAVSLADRSVSGESFSGVQDGQIGWLAVSDSEHVSPLGKSASDRIEVRAPLVEVVESLGGFLSIGSHDRDDTFVDLDAREDLLRLQDLDKGLASLVLLGELFFEQDDSTDVVLKSFRAEEQFSVGSSVFLGVFDVQSRELLSDGIVAFISSEDSVSSSGDVIGCVYKFLLKLHYRLDLVVLIKASRSSSCRFKNEVS